MSLIQMKLLCTNRIHQNLDIVNTVITQGHPVILPRRVSVIAEAVLDLLAIFSTIIENFEEREV